MDNPFCCSNIVREGGDAGPRPSDLWSERLKRADAFRIRSSHRHGLTPTSSMRLATVRVKSFNGEVLTQIHR